MDYWGGGGKYVSVCKACGKLGGVGLGACSPGKFCLFNLVESGTFFCTSIIHHLLCHYKAFIKA